jgi:hypothetical protein
MIEMSKKKQIMSRAYTCIDMTSFFPVVCVSSKGQCEGKELQRQEKANISSEESFRQGTTPFWEKEKRDPFGQLQNGAMTPPPWICRKS